MWCLYTYTCNGTPLGKVGVAWEHWRCRDAPRDMSVGQLKVQERSRGKNKDVFSMITESGEDRRAVVLKFALVFPNHLKGLLKRLFYRIPSSNFWFSSYKGSVSKNLYF